MIYFNTFIIYSVKRARIKSAQTPAVNQQNFWTGECWREYKAEVGLCKQMIFAFKGFGYFHPIISPEVIANE